MAWTKGKEKKLCALWADHRNSMTKIGQVIDGMSGQAIAGKLYRLRRAGCEDMRAADLARQLSKKNAQMAEIKRLIDLAPAA